MTKIISTFIKIIVNFSSFLIPDALFTADIFANFDYFVDYLIDILAHVNFLIPLQDIFSSIALMVTIDVVKFTIFIFNWVVKRVFDVIP